MQAAPTILVVDDEASIRYFLEEILTEDGYQVVVVDSGEAALKRITTQEFDLALIDLKLAGVEGLTVLSTLHQQAPKTALIVLTAYASLQSAVEALRQGAHDYLFKPCEPDKLRESVRTGLLKRQRDVRRQEMLSQLEESLKNNFEDMLTTVFERTTESSPLASPDAVCEAPQARLIVDAVRHIITLDDQSLDLSPTEFNLLAYLVQEMPRVISLQELAYKVLGYEGELWELGDLMRTHIYRIRQKLKVSGSNTDVIHTVRGVGYTIKLGQ